MWCSEGAGCGVVRVPGVVCDESSAWCETRPRGGVRRDLGAHRDAARVQNWPIIEISTTQKMFLFIIF